MGANNENKGIIVGVCKPMMEFLVQQAVHDNDRDVIIYQPTRSAEVILRKALPEPKEE